MKKISTVKACHDLKAEITKKDRELKKNYEHFLKEETHAYKLFYEISTQKGDESQLFKEKNRLIDSEIVFFKNLGDLKNLLCIFARSCMGQNLRKKAQIRISFEKLDSFMMPMLDLGSFVKTFPVDDLDNLPNIPKEHIESVKSQFLYFKNNILLNGTRSEQFSRLQEAIRYLYHAGKPYDF